MSESAYSNLFSLCSQVTVAFSCHSFDFWPVQHNLVNSVIYQFQIINYQKKNIIGSGWVWSVVAKGSGHWIYNITFSRFWVGLIL